MKKIVILISVALLSLQVVVAQHDVNYKTVSDIEYRQNQSKDSYEDTMCRMDLYYPQNTTDYPTVIWFHGGGLTGGRREIPNELKNRGYAVVGVEYRLSPKVKTHQCIDDAAAATAWVFKNIELLGGNKSKIYLCGHSAGGYLLLMIGYDKKYLDKYGVDADNIAALISYSGQAVTHFTNRAERGISNTQAIIDEYAPIYHVRAGAPKTVLITGGRDIELLGRYEENAYMWRMLQLVGHKDNYLYELDGFDHGAMAVPAHSLAIKHIK